MKTGTKVIIGIAIVAVVGIVVALNLRAKDSSQEADTEVAARKPMVSKVSATGNLKAKAQVNIQPEALGKVARLYVKEGDVVRKGQVLCELDRTNYESAAELARIATEQANRTLVRAESLYRMKLFSSEAYEQVRTQSENAQAQYRQTKDQLEKTIVTAPISGRIVQLNVEEGEMAITGMTNISGSVLMVIADLADMLALVDASETYVPSIKPGQKANLKLDAFPDTTFDATVTRVGYMPIQTALTSTEKSTDFEIELKLDQPTDALRPGMTATADIITSQRDSILSVPIQAVGKRKIKSQEVQSLFVLKGGVAKLTPVTTGTSSDTDIEILDGIEPGATVVTGPYKVLSVLKDGAKVRAKTEGEKSATTNNAKPDSAK